MRLRAFGLTALILAATPLDTANSQSGSQKIFVDRLIAASGALLQDANAAPKCRALIGWAYDLQGIARSVAGGAWNTANPADRAAYLAAFEQSAISGCAKFAANERGALLAFAGTRPAENGEQLVAARVIADGRNERTWIWRIRTNGENHRVVDVVVDGVSMLANERRDISQAIASGGSLSAATEFLRNRANR